MRICVHINSWRIDTNKGFWFFSAAIIFIAVKKNELIPSIAAVVLALLVVIIAGVGGMGASKALISGGMRIIRWARVWLLVTAIINAALMALKQFVIKNN